MLTAQASFSHWEKWEGKREKGKDVKGRVFPFPIFSYRGGKWEKGKTCLTASASKLWL